MKVFFVSLTLLISQICFSQHFDKIKLDSYFDTLEKNNKFWGNVAVSQHGKIIYTRSVGFSDYENKVPANINTKYRIGSITKTFTTVLVLKAVEENKLKLSQTIDKFFPCIKNSNKISIEQLLTHRSGIHNFTNDKDYLTWNTNPRTEKELVDFISKSGSDFEPGNKADYSNSNFVLLTYILQKTFSKPYSELLSNYIIKPLNLKNTFLGGKIMPSKNEAKSYKFKKNWELVSETDMSIPVGAGAIVSTASNIVAFSNALFSGKILRKESLNLMKTIKDGYGAGLFTVPFYDKTGYGHTGGIDGFTSVFYHFSDSDISYALVSNGSNFNNNDITVAVLSAVYDKPYYIPTFNFNSYKLDPTDLDKYPGNYSSTQHPLKITVTKENNILLVQATGQPSFPLEAIDKDKFRFEAAGLIMEFNPTEKTMILKQGGGKFIFKKD